MVAAQLLQNYHLNHVVQLDLSVVIVTPRVVETALHHVRVEVTVVIARCLKVIGHVLAAEALSASYLFSLVIPRTSSAWTASNPVVKE